MPLCLNFWLLGQLCLWGSLWAWGGCRCMNLRQCDFDARNHFDHRNQSKNQWMIPLPTWVAAKEWYISMSKESKQEIIEMKWHVNIRVFRKGQKGRHLEPGNDDFQEQSRFLRGSFSGSWKSTSKMSCKTVLDQVSPSEMLETVRSSRSGNRSGRSFSLNPQEKTFGKWWFWDKQSVHVAKGRSWWPFLIHQIEK